MRDGYLDHFLAAQAKLEQQNKFMSKVQFIDQFAAIIGIISAQKLQSMLGKYYELCLEQVAIVRENAAKKLTAPLFRVLDTKSAEGLITELKYFKGSQNWVHRTAFVCMMSSLLETAVGEDDLVDSILIKHFGADLRALCDDKVVGVRLQISLALANLFERFNALDEETKEIRRPKIE